MSNRIRRTLLSLAAVGFALSASVMGVSAGEEPGGCGYCYDTEDIVCTGAQELRVGCQTQCGYDEVVECIYSHINCWNFEESSFDDWIECGPPN